MAWFKRSTRNISDATQKKDIPAGMWRKCEGCGEIIHQTLLEENLFTCLKCNYHFRVGSREYFSLLTDKGSFKEMDAKMRSTDPLGFVDTKAYKDRIKESIKKSALHDAVRTGRGKIEGISVVIACMDFSFIGGSMGSVVGEKVARAIDLACQTKRPLIIVSSTGGARMMEGALSLMQMGKTSSKLAVLGERHIPFVSILTDPTTGGVTASWAMLGDIILAEPGALIGFAGPRVIRQTIGKELPKGFQRAEFLLEHGFVDHVVHRKEMKQTVARLLRLIRE
jgi:acetyl-CoA carboxylase carboxyl transferase subunit beta